MSEGIQIPDAILAVCEQALNRYLALDPEGMAAFAALEGRIIGIEIEGFGTRITLIPSVRGVQLYGAYEGGTDCLIRGTPVAILRLGMKAGKDAEPVAPDTLQVEGDTALAQALGAAFAKLDVDWEEQLARVIGDPFAHRVGLQARSAQRWGERTSESLRTNLKEYLQEESRLLPTRYEMEAFLAQVDTLRDDVERLAARIERLSQRATETGSRQ